MQYRHSLHGDTRGLRDNARGLREDIWSPHDHSYFREQIANSIWKTVNQRKEKWNRATQ